jgi:hypothetical protein
VCGPLGTCGIVDAPRFWGWRGFSARALRAVAVVFGDRNGRRKSFWKASLSERDLASSAAHPQRPCPPPSARPRRSAPGHRGARLSPLDLALHLLPSSFESVPIHLATVHSQAALISAQSRATGREAISSQPPFECAPHRQCKRNCRRTSTGSTPRRALVHPAGRRQQGCFVHIGAVERVSTRDRRSLMTSSRIAGLASRRLKICEPADWSRRNLNRPSGAWRAGPQKTGRQTGRMAGGVLVVV